jgi:hypothetical protein
MAELTYNGIEFSMIHVLRYDEEPDYEQSHTDWKYTKVTIQVSAIFAENPDRSAALLPGDDDVDVSVSDTVVRIRTALNTPRKLLEFRDGGNLIVSYGAAFVPAAGEELPTDAQFDVKNGPFPKVFSITRFDGSTSYHVSFSVETYIISCSKLVGLLTHRWKETLSYDEMFTAKYSRSGIIVVASTFNTKDGTVNADTTGRASSFIPLRNGFRRENVNFVLSDDGLALDYNYDDVQLYRMMPPGSLRASGNCTETTTTGAPSLSRSVTLTVAGAPYASQQVIFNIALTIAIDRLLTPSIVNGKANSGIYLTNAHIVQNLWENSVTVGMTAFIPNPQNAFFCKIDGKVLPARVPFAVTTFIFRVPYCNTYVSTDPNNKIPFEMPLPLMAGGTQAHSKQTSDQIALIAAALGVPCTPVAGQASR